MQRLPRWPSQISPVRVVIAIVIVAAIIIGVLVATLPPAPVPPDVVQSGDFVQVSYIGFFTNGRVFDTSLQHVAEDNATWPKAVSFELRLSYSPLGFQVGSTPPTVIEGFEHGVLFPTPMRVGEAREVVVPPEMGYGPPDPSRIEVRPLREELTQFETLLRAEFAARFPQQDPVAGLTFTHPIWAWPIRVVEASDDFVTLMHLPQVGFIIQAFEAWDARVLEVDTSANGGQGRIVVMHLLDLGDIDSVKAEDDQGTFRIVNVNPGAGTYAVDYNDEVVGQTLIFRIEVISIDRS
ncbi:MAG: FKBP-type peptidyl-prolyl cis-trans isomerase [Candidatus Thermoplasmatota archaeon]|nr:FKBP-type peptidyl-prolyl cis-trans isomerase [Candidatus Thermoplasmatota archaeon]